MAGAFTSISNERNEPPHVYVEKGDVECKYWLNIDEFDIEEAYAYNLRANDRRRIRKIIFENLEYFVEEYQRIYDESEKSP